VGRPITTPQLSAALFSDLPVSIGQVVLFSECSADEAFLRRLYRSTREDELAASGWPEAIKQSFCDSQFDLQHAHYVRHHPGGEFLVLRLRSEPIGRIYLDGTGESVHVIDIAIMPMWRGRGIGSDIFIAMQRRAAAIGKAVSLQVLCGNYRAIELYRRLGFVPGGIDGSYLSMQWHGAAESAKLS
jgi:ribosomal protein S18 acetylase RimI-like enzyme